MKGLRFLKKHGATILTVLGGAGVVGTGIASTVDHNRYWKLKDSDGFDFKKAFKAYIPTMLIGGATIGCIFGSNGLNKQEIAGLAATCVMLNRRYSSYRNAVIERHGEEEDKKIQAELVKTCANYHCVCPDTPDEKFWWRDPYTEKKFQRYERDIIDAELHLNRNFILRGYCSVNEFREFLGLDPVPKGEDFGWTMDEGYCFIDFEHKMNDDGLCEIMALFYPTANYTKYWEGDDSYCDYPREDD